MARGFGKSIVPEYKVYIARAVGVSFLLVELHSNTVEYQVRSISISEMVGLNSSVRESTLLKE